jgi:hypothetical protein
VQIYEYAGFLFVVIKDGDNVDLRAAAGQRSAAYKDKHRRAAIQCYHDDNEEK